MSEWLLYGIFTGAGMCCLGALMASALFGMSERDDDDDTP